jgi:formylmethanofuran dehydrogenase subunit E
MTLINNQLLEKAVKLHGHLGPFLVLGLKVGLRAKEILGAKPEKCELETVNCKPYLCAIDGIKTVMGCGTIIVKEGKGLAAKFKGSHGREVLIKVKEALVKKYAEGPWEKCEEYAYEVISSDEEQLFE